MLALLGLMGAVFAGFMVDALYSTDTDEDSGAGDGTGRSGAAGGLDGVESLLNEVADLNAANDPSAGLPVSDDGEGPLDKDVTLAGGAANDILTGDGGDDRISGAAGNDLLGGRAGDDLIDGGKGFDWMHGGAGDDTLTGASGVDDLHGEDGDDRMTGGRDGDLLSGDGGRDQVNGGGGNDGLIGGKSADVLQGGMGDDAVQGGMGHDRAMGGNGSDIVDGNDGDDSLWGDRACDEDGSVDFLNGGAGDDVLNLGAGDYGNGGTGADDFVLSDIAAGDPVARITDFDRAEDTLVLIYDAAHHADPAVSIVTEAGSPDAIVMLDGVAVAHVQGGAGLKVTDVTLQTA